MSEWNYVIAAYAVTWGVIFGYGLYLVARKRSARQRITALEQQ
jgi:CcmD family protein